MVTWAHNHLRIARVRKGRSVVAQEIALDGDREGSCYLVTPVGGRLVLEGEKTRLSGYLVTAQIALLYATHPTIILSDTILSDCRKTSL